MKELEEGIPPNFPSPKYGSHAFSMYPSKAQIFVYLIITL
jgi:hypothetical protein